MATGVREGWKTYLKLLEGQPPCPRTLFPQLWEPASHARTDTYTATISLEAALALEDTEFIARAMEWRRGLREDERPCSTLDECFARTANLRGAKDFALQLAGELYTRKDNWPRTRFAVTYAEALANASRFEEADAILRSNPLPTPPPRTPKILLSELLVSVISFIQPRSLGTLFKHITTTRACRHTLVHAKAIRALGEPEMAKILLRAASRMNVAPLYTPLLRVQCAHGLAECGSFQEALMLLDQPLEHNYFGRLVERWRWETEALLRRGL